MNPNPITLVLTQGRSRDFARQTPNDDGTYGGVYAGSEPITWRVWPLDSEVLLLSQIGTPNTWINALLTQWLISFADAQTQQLDPGTYRLEVTAPIGSRTGVLFEGLLEVAATAGLVVPSPPDLISGYYASKQLAMLGLTNVQVEALPDIINAASQLIRRWCGDRIFNQTTLTNDFRVSQFGLVRLDQIPVNQVYRVQATPQIALKIANANPNTSNAQVYFTMTGDVAGGQTITGLTLNAVTNGIQVQEQLAYTNGEVIGDLAIAINGVGNGWTCSTSSPFNNWPVTELIGGEVAQGALQAAGAVLSVYSQDLDDAYLVPEGHQTGMLYVGFRGGADPIGPSWGPDWPQWALLGSPGPGTVRVTYNAGFAVVPTAIQSSAAELTKAILERFRLDAYLGSETAGQYSYTLGENLWNNLPRPVAQTINLYRLHNV
jgi:hypothetical protein